MFSEFENRHPYLAAKERFMAGEITRLQAVAMVASDREFVAEVELDPRHANVFASARAVVEQNWVPELVLAITKGKKS